MACLSNTVMEIVRVLDPEGVASRRRGRLHRRSYRALGPNYIWHRDGHDKLNRYGFHIHGCIDGFSRKVMWLNVGTSNKNPKSVAHHYLQTIEKLKLLPTLLRSDRGTENVWIEYNRV